MAKEKNDPAAPSTDRELVIARIFDVPRELVWQVMTDPQQVVHWWGPRGFTTTIHEMDLRPGGVWSQTLHGPDGADYQNKSVFKEVTKPQHIVYALGGGKEGTPSVQFESTWTFEALNAGAQTRVTIRMVFSSAADRDRVVNEYGAIEGGKQTLARLAEHLPTMYSAQEFVLIRFLDAPRQLVWKAWTDPRQMAQWWGPHHFTNPVCELDVRPGGGWRIVMRGSDGVEHPCKGVYREVLAPQRLVLTIDHSDLPAEWHDRVNPTRDKSAGIPALEALATVSFDEEAGKTKLTIRLRYDSTAIREGFLKVGMAQGWSQSLERLEAVVAGSGTE